MKVFSCSGFLEKRTTWLTLSGGWSRFVVVSQGLQFIRDNSQIVELLADGHQLTQDRPEELLGGRGGCIQHFHGDLLDP